jgi:hypothetical protein
MKVKVRGMIYDAEEEPVMVILGPKDKENIANMDSEHTKYCAYPDHMDEVEVEEFMKTPADSFKTQ